ncbi:MAG: Cell envelope-associated transcriptional attenuator LytR-CpsA-Psr, subfamily M [Firmicutes bacterium]|nr:Cell envelope-associated transcriptional attenuator LytR-CpsA-Psr, subfamily M [Bacillota bacterium]
MSRKLVLVICIFIISVLFIDGLAILYYAKEDMDTKIRGNNRNQIENNTRDTRINNQQEGYPINLLILGLDGDGTRADVILLANYKPGKNSVNILSITRDTKVVVNGKTTKINALVGMGGEKLIISKVEDITGLPVNYYLTMDFVGFRKIIDGLGGVEIDVPFDMHYDDPAQNLHIHLNKGRQVLDGKKAEQFVRYRKGNISGQGYRDGDLGRIEAQQLFIRELVKQKFNLKYISKIDDIYAVLKEHTKTNIQLADIMYYLKNFNIKIDEIKTWTIPGNPRDEARI